MMKLNRWRKPRKKILEMGQNSEKELDRMSKQIKVVMSRT
jgi:hypothetical protein